MTDQSRKTGARTIALEEFDRALCGLNITTADASALMSTTVQSVDGQEIDGYHVTPDIVLSARDGKLYTRSFMLGWRALDVSRMRSTHIRNYTELIKKASS